MNNPNDAERQREDAERRREASEEDRKTTELYRQRTRLTYSKIATVVALPLALITLIPSIVGIVLLQDHNQRLEQEIMNRCIDSQVNRNAIRDSIFEGLSTLGYRYNTQKKRVERFGEPIDYFATHPEERAEALRRTLVSLSRFPVIECNEDKEEG